MLRQSEHIQKRGAGPARFLAWALLVCGSVVLLTACGGGGRGGGGGGGPTMTITPITNTAIPMRQGEVVNLEALTSGSYQSHEFDASRISALDTGSPTRTYRASSSLPMVATVGVSNSMVTVTPQNKGTATITIEAESPPSAHRMFDYMVRMPNRKPTTSGTISAVTLTAVGNTDTRDVSSRFTDPDGDTLSYTARSSNINVVTTSISGSVVTVTAVRAGNATITVTARDNDPTNPLTAVQTFSVTVSVSSTGLAPADQAAFNTRVVGKRISISSDYYVDFISPGRLRVFEDGTTSTGSYTYTNTGPNTGRLVSTYDDGDRCTSNITYTSATTGSSTDTCTSGSGSYSWRLVDSTPMPPASGRAGECRVGGTYGPGESCDVYGVGSNTKLPFTVQSDGRGHFGFGVSGNSIQYRNSSINGVTYNFVASHQGNGVWRVDEYRP